MVLLENLPPDALLTPRFAVEQGHKIRPVDDCSRSGINMATAPSEKLHYEGLDHAIAGFTVVQSRLGSKLKLWKADIDSAFRRIPIQADQRNLGWVTFRTQGKVIACQHLTMMFGAASSVHCWDRVGAFISTVARKVLHMPVMRQVCEVIAVPSFM